MGEWIRQQFTAALPILALLPLSLSLSLRTGEKNTPSPPDQQPYDETIESNKPATIWPQEMEKRATGDGPSQTAAGNGWKPSRPRGHGRALGHASSGWVAVFNSPPLPAVPVWARRTRAADYLSSQGPGWAF